METIRKISKDGIEFTQRPDMVMTEGDWCRKYWYLDMTVSTLDWHNYGGDDVPNEYTEIVNDETGLSFIEGGDVHLCGHPDVYTLTDFSREVARIEWDLYGEIGVRPGFPLEYGQVDLDTRNEIETKAVDIAAEGKDPVFKHLFNKNRKIGQLLMDRVREAA